MEEGGEKTRRRSPREEEANCMLLCTVAKGGKKNLRLSINESLLPKRHRPVGIFMGQMAKPTSREGEEGWVARGKNK